MVSLNHRRVPMRTRAAGALIKALVVCAMACLTAAPADARTVLREWRAEDLRTWGVSRVKERSVNGGELILTTEPGDSQLSSPAFDAIPAAPWQHVEIEMQAGGAGRATLFWTGTTAGQFGGFAGEKVTSFTLNPGKLVTYRIEPFWQAEKQILRLRLDFPEQTGERYAIRAIRIVEDAPGAPVTLPVQNPRADATGVWRGRVSWAAENGSFVTVRMAAPAGKENVGVVSFASDAVNGMRRLTFPLRRDGRAHTYNVDMARDAQWRGRIVELRVEPVAGGAKTATLESVTVGDEPQGPPDLEVTFLGLSDPVARSGKPVRLEARVKNHGGETARQLKPQLTLTGARVLRAEPVPAVVESGVYETLAWTVQADKAGKVRAALTLPGAGSVVETLEFRAPLHLAKASYVPVPQPARTGDYKIGAYYFPGWHTSSRWQPLRPFPERQPLLGWYREGSPEVADWQIKWAVEHGISFFLYDWYWDRGARHLEHGLHEALFNARYQNMIEFCLLYANHNPTGSHSYEDFEEMTRFWIENYFRRPNYMKIDGKPVVVMFSSENPVRDMGLEKAKAAFERMRALCREAGLGGLYLVACTNTDPSRMARLKEYGYDAVTAYNWPGVNMTAEEVAARRAPYATGIVGYRESWEKLAATNTLPLIPPVFAGWDSRPWHGDNALVRYDRTPALFKRHLMDAKRFLDTHKTPEKMLFIEAWNELGEGSYIEPHREFGFGYLEAVRQVFAPNSPKPAEVLPGDVGLGPYDVPDTPPATAWDFTRATDTLGWGGNVVNPRIEDGAMRFTTRGHDPILSSPRLQARASRYPVVSMRIKASRDIDGQLFWATVSAPISEASSVRFPIKGDGQFQTIRLPLGDNPRWRGIISSLRFDPGNESDVDVAVEFIRLEEK